MNFEAVWKEALSRYSLHEPGVELIRHNENATFRVRDSSGSSYVLRAHQPREGFSQALFPLNREAALRGELQILSVLAACTDIPVQRPVRNMDGDTVTVLPGGELVTLLTWLDGETPGNEETDSSLLQEVGRMAAKMHRCFQTCGGLPEPAGRVYDRALLGRMAEKTESMERMGILAPEQLRSMHAAIAETMRRMEELHASGGQFGIVHSDLSRGNLVVFRDKVSPIDFGLWGYGYYYMDLGALASHFTKQEEQEAIFRGYEDVSGTAVRRRYVEPFICLGILLFICAFGENVYKEPWFADAVTRWCDTAFDPLSAGA